MTKFIETICIINGKPKNLPYHNRRMNETRNYFFRAENHIDLNNLINLPDDLPYSLKIKCRIVYSDKIDTIEYSRYEPKRVNSLKLVVSDSIDYSYKYLRRNEIDELYQNRGEGDDILIVKKGLVTDTSIHNIAFFDGKNWLTPEKPLLNGTMRAYLLENEIIKKSTIFAGELRNFEKARLFNSMLGWEDEIDIPVGDIYE